MKVRHLFPLIALTVNVSATNAPAPPKPAMETGVFVLEKEAVNEEETIAWQTDRKLLWDDFLCSPQRQGDAVASTSTSLGVSYQVKKGQLAYSITCHFSKKKSWGILKTDYILAHEQAHFDITELHARKLYAALNNYAFNSETFKKDIAVIYEQIVKEKEDMQAAYDGETDHSRRRVVQQEWLERIDGLLTQSEAFAQYP